MVSMPRNKSILLIDDNEIYCETMHLALEKSGFECRTASTLEAADIAMRQNKFDLIVCDYFMPETDGRSILENLGVIDRDCLLVLTSSYPLEIKFKKGARFLFIDKLCLLDWLKEKFAVAQYV